MVILKWYLTTKRMKRMIRPDYTCDSSYTFTTADGDVVTGDISQQTVTISLPDQGMFSDSITGGTDTFTFTTTPEPSSITLGKVVLTEERLERLTALLDIIEGMGESDLLDMLNTQTALNKVKNDKTESD